MEKIMSLNLLTVEEAANIACVSESHLYHGALAKNITSVKIGGLLRFCKTDVGIQEGELILEDFLMDTKKLAEILKVHTSWIYANGTLLKAVEVKVGKATRYSAVKLLKLINRSREERTKKTNEIEEQIWDHKKGRLIIFPGCPGYKSKV